MCVVSSKRKLSFFLLSSAGRCELDLAEYFVDAHCDGHPVRQFSLLFNPGSVVDVEPPHCPLLRCLFSLCQALVDLSLTLPKILLALNVDAIYFCQFLLFNPGSVVHVESPSYSPLLWHVVCCRVSCLYSFSLGVQTVFVRFVLLMRVWSGDYYAYHYTAFPTLSCSPFSCENRVLLISRSNKSSALLAMLQKCIYAKPAS